MRLVNPDERTAVYRFFDAQDTLLYVGISHQPTVRFASHATTKRWWGDVARIQIDWCDTRTEAEAAEVAAIRTESPKWNKALPDETGRYTIGVGRPRWSPPNDGVATRIERTVSLYRQMQEVETALWESVEATRAAGVPDMVLCERSGISRATLNRRLGSRKGKAA